GARPPTAAPTPPSAPARAGRGRARPAPAPPPSPRAPGAAPATRAPACSSRRRWAPAPPTARPGRRSPWRVAGRRARSGRSRRRFRSALRLLRRDGLAHVADALDQRVDRRVGVRRLDVLLQVLEAVADDAHRRLVARLHPRQLLEGDGGPAPLAE